MMKKEKTAKDFKIFLIIQLTYTKIELEVETNKPTDFLNRNRSLGLCNSNRLCAIREYVWINFCGHNDKRKKKKYSHCERKWKRWATLDDSLVGLSVEMDSSNSLTKTENDWIIPTHVQTLKRHLHFYINNIHTMHDLNYVVSIDNCTLRPKRVCSARLQWAIRWWLWCIQCLTLCSTKACTRKHTNRNRFDMNASDCKRNKTDGTHKHAEATKKKQLKKMKINSRNAANVCARAFLLLSSMTMNESKLKESE